MLFPTEKHLQNLRMDKFGYKNLSKKILDEIILKMELPNCFGIYGNWGSGKSTIVHFMMEHLKGKQEKYKTVTPVYFEPWKYEYSDHKDLLFALLKCIKKTLNVDDIKIWEKVLIDAIAIATGVLRIGTGLDIQKSAEDLELIEKKTLKEHQTWIDKVEDFKETFQAVINKGLEKAKTSKLVIFIDDLDRCLPENAVSLLEGIKNFLATENTLFVLAIDRRIIAEMIGKKYDLHQSYGDEYLMKIIPYYFELPKIKLLNIAKEIIESYGLKNTERQIGYIAEFLHNFGKEPRVAKHILHQFCMRVHISDEIQSHLNKDIFEISLQYIFVASFILHKFPKLFSTIDNRERLSRLANIRDSASLKKNPNKSEQYKHIIDKDALISSKDRQALESIIQYSINRLGTANPEETMDVAILNQAMEMIKS